MEMGSNSFQVSTSTFINNEVRYGNKRMCLGNSGRVVKQPPRCQVEGCNVDLSGVKAYYCRHKVCGMHSKSPMVIVAGSEQRFCQQCSRFHQLAEFDQGKRSCRRRLACHNERRRKPHSSSSSRPSCNGLPSSPFHAQLNRAALDSNSRLRSFLMNFSYPHLYQGDVYAFSLLSTHPLTNVLLVKESQTPPPPTTTTNGVLSNNGFGDVASNMQTNNSFASSEVRPALQKKRQCMEHDDVRGGMPI